MKEKPKKSDESFQVVCKDCGKIIIEDIDEEHLYDLGEYIQCPYCMNFKKNPLGERRR
jgi:DNA-directed RNA polymerase subunit RPC12/RpoP